jgi:hypothetical protein
LAFGSGARGDFRQVKPAVQRRHRRGAGAGEQREHPVIEVAVQDVEPAGFAAHALHLRHVRGDGVAQGAVEPQRRGPHAFQVGGGLRIAAGEQGDVVPHVHQGLGQVGDDPLGAAIEARGHGLGQWGDLGDTHVLLLSR